MTQERKRFSIVPIEQVDVFAAIQEKLTDMIYQGGFAAGDKLPAERALAAQLNVSRNAVREALKVLQATGKVRIVHGSGTFVSSVVFDPISDLLRPDGAFTPEYLQHLTDVRAAISVRVAESAARKATEKDIAELSIVLSELACDQEESPDVGSLNVSFEQALARIGGNPMLTTLLTSIDRLWVEAWGGLHISPGPRGLLHAEHTEIFEAVKRNDTEQASKLMSFHVDREVSGPAIITNSELLRRLR